MLTHRLCPLFFNFSSVPQTWLISIVLSSSSLSLTSACSNLPLNLSSEFFRLLLFSAQELFFKVFYLLIFLFHSPIVFLTFFTFSFSSLSIFKTVILRSLSSISAILAFPRSVSADFFPFEWLILYCFFVCLFFFFLVAEYWIFECNNVETLKVRFSPFRKDC